MTDTFTFAFLRILVLCSRGSSLTRRLLIKLNLITRMPDWGREAMPETTTRRWLAIDHYDCGVVAAVFRRPSSDEIVFRQVFHFNELFPFINLLKIDPSRVRYVVDAGANCGLTAIFLARMFPAATIVSLEPDELNYQQAKRNIHLNGIRSVKLIKAALWVDDRSLTLNRPDGVNADFSVKVDATDASSTGLNVPGVSLEKIMKDLGWNQIDLLKLDIEGAEQALFSQGAPAWLSKVRALSVEPHVGYSTSEGMASVLRSQGWYTVHYGELLFGKQSGL